MRLLFFAMLVMCCRASSFDKMEFELKRMEFLAEIHQSNDVVGYLDPSNTTSLREKAEMIFFLENGKMLSSVTVNERREHIKSIIPDSVYSNILGVANVSRENWMLEMHDAVFLATELFVGSAENFRSIAKDSLECMHGDYYRALGYLGDKRCYLALEEMLAAEKNIFMQTSVNTELILSSELSCVCFGKLSFREMKMTIDRAKERLRNDSDKMQEQQYVFRAKSRSIIQSLRYADYPCLASIAAFYGLLDDPIVRLELLKESYSKATEKGMIAEIVEHYSDKAVSLDSNDSRLLWWACKIIENKFSLYKTDSKLVDGLKSIGMRDDASCSDALNALRTMDVKDIYDVESNVDRYKSKLMKKKR